ncbi:MAG: thioredoxin [Candidatus Zixiibacteriota bacterium]|nr:MAG: thioredoxin [candidate division Zixibacteria bacterium]
MEHEITLTDATFDEQITQSATPVLVDFWAPWCAPCRIIAPVLSGLAQDYAGQLTVGKVNVDENPAVAARFGITGIPTLLLFKNGKPVGQWIGALPRPMLEQGLKPHLAPIQKV